MKITRLIFLIVIGCILASIPYRLEHEDTFLDAFLLLALIPTGIILFLVTLSREMSVFRKEKRIRNFTFTLTFLALITIGIFKTIRIDNNFNKPTLLKAFYDETSIDFKTDSTYIVRSSSLGGSSNAYGRYNIRANKITLDKNNIFNIIKSNILEIREIEIKDSDSIKKEKQLLQVNEDGDIINPYSYFRVITDNRDKTK